MKNFLFCLIFFIASFSFSHASDFKVLARVNDRIITQYDLNNYSKIFQIYLKSDSKISLEVKREILNSLIEEILKEEAIKRENIAFDEEEFKYFLELNKENEDFEKQLKRSNIDRTLYTDLLKVNFLWSKLIDTKIKPSISINNSEVNDSLEYLMEKPLRTRYDISQIVLYKNSNSDPKAIADKLYEEIKSKNNFESIANKFSQDNKKNKGYVGWVDEMDINIEIYNAIKTLQVGAISRPIYFGDESSGYYIIVKLNNKKQERVAKRDDIARVQYFIYNQKLNLEIKNYVDNLYNNAFIEIY